MADEVETRTYEQLPRATAVSPDALMAFQEEGGPLAAIELKKLLGRLISTDAAFEAEAAPDGIQSELNHSANSIGLVYADATPAKNGWYRKVGASGAGHWEQFEKLSDYAAAEVEALVEQARVYADTTASSVQGSFRELGEVSFSGYPTPFPAGVGYAGAAHYVWEIPQAKRGKALGIKVGCGQAGTFEFGFYTRQPDGLIDRVRFVPIDVEAAGTTHIAFVLDKEAGELPGIRVIGDCIQYGSGADPSGGWYSSVAVPFTDLAKTITTPIFAEFEIAELDVIEKLDARTSKIESDFYETLTAIYGLAAPIADQAVALDNSYYVVAAPNIRDERVTRVAVNFEIDGPLTIYAFSGGASKAPVRSIGPIAVTAGAHYIDIDPPLLIEEGQHFGFRAPGLGTTLGVSAGLSLLGSADLPVTSVAPVANVRAGIGYEVEFTSPVLGGGGGGGARPANVDLPWDNMLTVTMGQSLGEGSRAPGNPGYAPITTVQEYDTVCLPAWPANPNALLPATVANSERKTNSDLPGEYLRGEWSGLGAARQLRDALAREHNITHTTMPNRIVIVNDAIGSKRIDQLAKDTLFFNAALAQASALPTLAGASAGVLSIHFAQGESDGADFANTGYEVYKGRFKAFAKDVDAGMRAATGQKRRVPTIAYQVTSHGSWEISQAQFDASLEDDLIHIACPMYHLDYYDPLHIDGPSERHLGGYYGEADAALLRGEKWEPLRPVALDVVGNFATFTFNKSGLVLDTAIVPAQPGYGFTALAADGVTAVAQTSAALLHGNRLRLTWEAPLAPGAQIFYGKNAAVGKAPYTGGAGNLRDSAGDNIKIDGRPLHNWLVVFGWTV